MIKTRPTPQSESLAGLEWPKLWEALSDRLHSEYGKTRAGEFGFLDDLTAIRSSLAEITEMETLLIEEQGLDFGGITNISDFLTRAEKGGRLEIDEILEVVKTQQAAVSLGNVLKSGQERPLLQELAEECHQEGELCTTLSGAITQDGEISGRAFPQLAKPRRELASRRKAILERLEALLRSRKLAKVFQEKIYTVRGFRFVLPVKADFKGRVPGIVHDVSATGATLFIEPEAVVEASNAVTLAEKQLEALTDAILRELTALIGKSSRALRENLAWLGRVDLLQAQAGLSRSYRGTAPLVEDEGRIVLKGVVNPLMLLDGEEPVPNDVELPEDVSVLVISGANTGGKTVLLKSIGLCAFLVRCGMPVPARKGSRMDLFRQIRADIGDRQSLSNSLSTFSAQIRFMAETLENEGAGKLILIDEILTGTAPQEGAALAEMVLGEFARQGDCCIATTHYGALKEMAAAHPAMENASMAFDPENLRPTFRLVPGIPGASFAFPIARRYGLENHLVTRAEELLSQHPVAAEALAQKLQQLEQNLQERGKKLEEKMAQLERRESALREKERGLEEREREGSRRDKGAIGKEVEIARRKIASVIKDLQSANNLTLAGKVSARLREVKREVLPSQIEKHSEEQTLNLASLSPGDPVLLRSYNRLATLAEVPQKGRQIRVLLGSVTMEVDLADLGPPPENLTGPKGKPGGASAKSGKKAGGAGGKSGRGPSASPAIPEKNLEDSLRLALPTSDNSLDLRGLRLDEAKEKTEGFFDHCTMKNISPVVLIHGHGTGKLKSGLRDWLGGNIYVTGFRAGEGGEGRDGVTVVALNL